MDEVGFCISGVNQDGTLMSNQVGMTPDVLPSKRVLVGKNALPGVICARPVHLISDKDGSISVDDLCIDIGCNDKESASSLDLVGSQAWFDSDFCTFGNGFIKSKALDDRIGCCIMCSLIKEELLYDTYFVFTVGEELGGVGASAATRRISPDKCLVLEGTTAADIPGNTGADRVCVLGQGPVCPFMDGGTLYDKDMYTGIRNLASINSIDSQTKTKVAGGTDAAKISQCLSGVRVAAISLACRYIHTSSSVASIKDAQNMQLLARLVVNSDL
jgi:endoglucanase